MFHKRINKSKFTWCGLEFKTSLKEMYFWSKVTCEECLKHKHIKGGSMVKLRKIHKTIHGTGETWCGQDGYKHHRWEHVNCKECLKHKVVRIRGVENKPPVKVEEIDMTKLRNYFNK